MCETSFNFYPRSASYLHDKNFMLRPIQPAISVRYGDTSYEEIFEKNPLELV